MMRKPMEGSGITRDLMLDFTRIHGRLLVLLPGPPGEQLISNLTFS